MSYPFLTPRYFAEEVEDAWHMFAERPHRELHRHVQGPLHEHLAKRIASDPNANQEAVQRSDLADQIPRKTSEFLCLDEE